MLVCEKPTTSFSNGKRQSDYKFFSKGKIAEKLRKEMKKGRPQKRHKPTQ